VGWVVSTLLGDDARDLMLQAIQPVGRGLAFAAADEVATTYASTAGGAL